MGRFASLILLLAAFVGCHSAPASTIIHPAQYYLLQPQPTTLKIQPHLIQPIQQLKIQPKQQLIYYYPSIPLGGQIHDKPLQLITLKEEETPWWQGFVNFFQPPNSEKPAESPEPSPEAPAEAESMKKQQTFMIPADAEQLPSKAGVQYSPQPQGHRYYILSGTPQFYGNFDALQNPLSPVFSLQPLQAIHARANSGILAEAEHQRLQPQIVTSVAPIAPVPALVPAQLKNDLLESHPDKVPAGDRTWARSLDEEPAPEPQQQELPQVQGRSQLDEPSDPMPPQSEVEERQQDDEETSRASKDPSVAAVKPGALAVAGGGGIAAAAPTGTAIVGKNGLALSSPSATSVAGGFFDEDEDKKD
ncbi:uncharacterized protein LOC131692936 [Topomyia yanbarensis]|uniref:uncharacterized protein LOC131692936 n=1 Tax=Topomyia yanbarensis TaxID=2498891 RepID=UPI00273B83AB|nr:uncharacterized protein LOC131692936 [Topomyia yanbarensis]XP_058836337.1 uncharacterized protein LOC131692936 [Topomyia yanbarensis]